MRKRLIRIAAIVFLCVIPVWMLFSKDKDFSESENRYLAHFPGFSVKSVADGSFMDGFEKYLADQFPLRNASITLKTNALRMIGQKRINGVYIAGGGYLIAGEEKFDGQHFSEMIESINTFAGANPDVKVSFMLAPNASLIYEEKLPYGVASAQDRTIDMAQELLSDKVDFVDVREKLRGGKSKQLYFKTDHHWTVAGAYLAFEEYAYHAGLDLISQEYETYCVCGDFQGTQASKCGVYNRSDVVNVCVPAGSEGSYIVKYVDDTLKKATLFDMERLEEKDKYLVFMGGNYSRVDIQTKAKNGRRLAVIKDSYANCLIPMLTPYYEEIIVIDPRYYYDDLYGLIKDASVDEVLILYNVNTFVTDNSLQEALKKS